MVILSSCNENKRIKYNEDRNTAWSDTIHEPSYSEKYNNRFINDGGQFLNSRGQVYYKLCSFNNNYLPDGLGIRE